MESSSDNFQTPRLYMRPLSDRDADLYCSLYTNPELMRNIAVPLSIEAAQRSFVAACRQQGPRVQRWIVAERKSYEDIGLLGLIGKGDGPEIGVMLFENAHGRGYGREAMAAMMEWGFTIAGLQWIYANQAVADNPPVVRMMSELGFTPLPPTEDKPQGGEWALPRADWEAARLASVAIVAANR
jgi:ribosomal-protein-alanine N-acetyltransferase